MAAVAIKIRLKRKDDRLFTLVGIIVSKKKPILKFVIDLALGVSETCEGEIVNQTQIAGL
jgi:hypothetical protein